MRILLLNTYYSGGGAAIATHRMLEGLRAAGYDARLLVASPLPDDAPPYVATVHGATTRTAFVLERVRVSLANRFDRRTLFRFSTNRFGTDITHHPWVKWAEIIHLHWIQHGFLSLRGLRTLLSLQDKRFFWSLHDFAPLTGGCHIPYLIDKGETDFCYHFYQRCQACPLLHSHASYDLSTRIFLKKWELPLEQVHFLGVSNAVVTATQHAPVTKRSKVSLLPNLYDPTQFYPPIEKAHNGERKILMVAARLDDLVKGFDIAIKVLRRACEVSIDFAQEAHLVIVGAVKNPVWLRKIPIRYTHHKRLPIETLAEQYRQATLTLSTSRYETFGQTLLESIASGTPAIAFAVGGTPDIIKPETGNGALVKPYSIDDMAHALIHHSEPHHPHTPDAIATTVSHLQVTPITTHLLSLYSSDPTAP